MGSFTRCPSIGNSTETHYIPEQIKLELALRNPGSRLIVYTALSALLSRDESVLTESLLCNLHCFHEQFYFKIRPSFHLPLENMYVNMTIGLDVCQREARVS
jgi:hypothetical protein